ncbi:MAG TPA: branched-chain amino acid ABC transporter permease [Azospirillaceae bacterium]|nr:branched-chain amino acid ABC transporter permease [Azospirillaceae bacterium]
MLTWILSGDTPRSRLLVLLLVATFVCLAAAPFLFPGAKPYQVATQILCYVLLVASYDLLLGYTGIVSFAHTMFFGLGAYGVAIALRAYPGSWVWLGIGAVAGIAAAGLLALVVGLFSLRVRAIFFAMVTLAVASAFEVLVSQLFHITGGEDGMSFRLPFELGPAFRPFGNEPVLGIRITGRTLAYYLVFAVALVGFLVLLRIVNSPFGRVLQAIRENDFRAEAIGFRTVVYRTLANVAAAKFAALAGALLAISTAYVGPANTLASSIMINILLMVVIGGMGTMYGAVLGAVVFILAQSYLQPLMGGVQGALQAVPVVPELFNPERWLLWLGILFILSVYFFPTGIVGRLRQGRAA